MNPGLSHFPQGLCIAPHSSMAKMTLLILTRVSVPEVTELQPEPVGKHLFSGHQALGLSAEHSKKCSQHS